MPKAFTDKEKEVIADKLLDGARECITRYGIRKTTVDDLARIAGISRGAFYLFYPSKEHLFYNVIMDCNEGLHKKFEDSIQILRGDVTLDRFLDHVIAWVKEVESSFLISVFQNGELEQLERRLPDDTVAEHHIGDDEMLVRLFGLLEIPLPGNITVFAGALRSVFLTMLYKRTVGEEIYYDVLRELLSSLFIKYIPNN